MIKPGIILAERYEVIERIGTGGMSDVYKAKDNKLNRFVAVKVLKQEFSENAGFVSKFIVEAQAAAGLMHPNIVNVYDVGEEAGIHYIIMELVEGITLKKYIEKKARLSFREAVSIAIQVSLGIEAAHNNHIIHRDIKPQNIIISKEGKVKVTDFGIAKAASSNTVTSNVMGSVHYTSPEQARGGYSDEKSDVYSLGVTLFEMLTGRVPFEGDTTVSIAIKHIQEPMPSPRALISEIPVSVEQIVLKCCQKAVDRRYQSMGALVEDLKQALLNPDEDFVHITDSDAEGATRIINAHGWYEEYDESVQEEEEEILLDDDDFLRQNDKLLRRNSSLRRNNNAAKQTAGTHKNTAGYTNSTNSSLRTRTDRVPEELLEREDDTQRQGNVEKITTIIMAVVGVLIVCMIIFLGFRILGFFGEKDNNQLISSTPTSESLYETGTFSSIEMVKVIGEKEDKMVPILRAKGLKVTILEEESMEYEEGIILRSDTEEGTILQEGDTVTITVSTGAGAIEIEDVVNLPYEQAKATLEQQGFFVNKSESYSNEVELGNVISQKPEGHRKVKKGSAVVLVVSTGEDKVRVPNVTGYTLDAAKTALTEAGVSIGSVIEAHSNTIPVGQICYQSYAEGSYVDRSTVVDLQVSKGYSPSTYSYKAAIGAPTPAEAPEYQAGSVADVSLVTEEGKVLLSTTTSTFPVSVDITGITSPRGTISIMYHYLIVESPATETSAAVTKDGYKMVTRQVFFTGE